MDPSRAKGTSFPTLQDGGRSHESNTSAVHDSAGGFDLTRQTTELQNELNQSRQQAANELAALRHEVRGAFLRGTQATGIGVDTRLLEKPSDFSGAQGRVARLEHSVQGVRWRSDSTSAEADGQCREGGSADPERHDRRR